MKSNIIFIIIFFIFCVTVKAQETIETSKSDSAEFKILTAGSLNLLWDTIVFKLCRPIRYSFTLFN